MDGECIGLFKLVWEFGSPKSRLVTEHHNAIYSNFNHSWTKGWVYTNLFLSYQLTLKWWSSELGPPLSVNSSVLRFALSLLYTLFNSSGASCVFYFNSSINTATIVGYASDCGIEILIWLLASIKIYKLGMDPLFVIHRYVRSDLLKLWVANPIWLGLSSEIVCSTDEKWLPDTNFCLSQLSSSYQRISCRLITILWRFHRLLSAEHWR